MTHNPLLIRSMDSDFSFCGSFCLFFRYVLLGRWGWVDGGLGVLVAQCPVDVEVFACLRVRWLLVLGIGWGRCRIMRMCWVSC